MQRRLMIAALACWPASFLLAQAGTPRPRHKISAAELHESLSARFPVRVGLGGLLELQISAPRLHLVPARNELGAALVAQVSGARMPRSEQGEVDVAFALRYEPGDRTLRAHRLEVLDMHWPALSPQALSTLRRVLPMLARDALGEVVLHRFAPRELALADTMGFEPDELIVVEDGLVILFGPKPRR